MTKIMAFVQTYQETTPALVMLDTLKVVSAALVNVAYTCRMFFLFIFGCYRY